DLGDVLPMQGAQVAVRAELHQDGAPQTPTAVFAQGEQADVIMTMAFVPDSNLASDSVTEFARVPFDREFVLHGLPAGRLQLMAQPAHDLQTLPHIQRVEPTAT